MLNISLEQPDDAVAIARVKQAEARRAAKAYQPTWTEIFVTGYQTHTGKHKKGLFELKNSDPDLKKLKEVRGAVESGEIEPFVDDRKKFSKSHALNVYKQLLEQRKAAIIKEMISNIPDNYHSIQTWEDLEWMVKYCYMERFISVDTETTGLHLEQDEVVGMSITLPESNFHCYIPFLHQNANVGQQLNKTEVMQYLQAELFADMGSMSVIMFNAKFDMHMLLKEGITFNGTVLDAMEGMKQLNENEPSYQLKKLANKWGRYFGYTDNSLTFEELFSRDPKDFYINADYRLCYYYACKDTHLTYLLMRFIQQQMDKQPQLGHVFHDIEVPITQVCVSMEQNGMALDLQYAQKYRQELETEIAELDAEIKQHFGDINWDSPKQVQAKLYDGLKLQPPNAKTRSADAKALKTLAKTVPEIAKVLDYRKKTKLLGSFIQPIPELVWTDDRIHGSFNQGGTKTGRFASDKPNMQNLPYAARPMFVAPEGKLIIGIDFSQIEPRVLAHMSGDKQLQQAYQEGRDLYATVAATVYEKKFGLTYEQCLEADQDSYKKVGLSVHPRKLFKTSLLSIMYETSAYSLAAQAGITVPEAEEMISDFHSNFPQAYQYSRDCIAFTDANGFVQTMEGRKRRFPDHVKTAKQYHRLHQQIVSILGREFSNIFEEKIAPYKLKQQYFPVMKEYNRVVRQIVNARTQGSAADIMKKAMIQLYSYLLSKGNDWKMIGTIHDEVLMEVPDSITAQEFTELENCMIHATELAVPLKVDTEVSRRWGQGISKEQYLVDGMNCWSEEGWLK